MNHDWEGLHRNYMELWHIGKLDGVFHRCIFSSTLGIIHISGGPAMQKPSLGSALGMHPKWHQASGIEQEKPKRPWFDHCFIAMMVNILEQYPGCVSTGPWRESIRTKEPCPSEDGTPLQNLQTQLGTNKKVGRTVFEPKIITMTPADRNINRGEESSVYRLEPMTRI